MEYVVVKRQGSGFARLELKDILAAIAQYADRYVWTIQDIYACGDIVEVTGVNYVTFEERVNSSDRGEALPFDTLCKLAEKFFDIFDITIVGYQDEESIPPVFKDKDWEGKCDVIITWFDSTQWELFSKNHEIMNIFKSFNRLGLVSET